MEEKKTALVMDEDGTIYEVGTSYEGGTPEMLVRLAYKVLKERSCESQFSHLQQEIGGL